VAFDWGLDGKLWVVEMRDYPLGLDNKGKPGGRIVYLEDTDGDGRYDKSTVFMDGLLFPTGIMTWGKGVLVTCAPDIFYMEDTNADGKADKITVLFTGFGEANPQHRVNGLRWGLDNWVYGANGDFAAVRKFGAAVAADKSVSGFSSSQAEDLRRLALAGARVKSVKTGAVWDIRNRDFRFRPEPGILDPQSGQAQFGRDRDDWGNWFGCNNAIPLWHFALEDHYLRRNPHAHFPSPRVDGPPSVTFPLRTSGRDTGTRRGPQGNPWTSACGITCYRDELFGPGFSDSWFACEPVHNVVHRGRLIPTGTTFSSRRAAGEETSEFLTSTDVMFSPVMVRTGPDGALWVADMYRRVLEHPHWLPAGWEKTVDVRAGHDRGRIYRIYPSGKRPRPWPRLDRLDTPGQVALLDSPNGWIRDKAQQLLVARKDKDSIGMLADLAGMSRRPLGRLHALCTLDGLEALTPELIERALVDPHAAVRKHAARLSEPRAARSAGVEAALVKLSADPDASVRQQVAYSLGAWDSPASARALGELLRRDGKDAYIAAAAVSSMNKNNCAAVVEAALLPPAEVPSSLVENLFRSALSFDDTRSLGLLLADIARLQNSAPARFAVLAGFLEVLDEQRITLTQLSKRRDKAFQTALERMRTIFPRARRTAVDAAAPIGTRVEALRLLCREPDLVQEDRAILVRLLAPQEQEPLQLAAAAVLGRADPQAPPSLLQPWKGYTPALRAHVLDILLARADGPAAVLTALEKKNLLPQEIPLTAHRRLAEHPSREVRTRAAKLLTDRVDPHRDKIVIAYQAALRLPGDAGRGQALFARHCASCHRLGDVGKPVGPDLQIVRDKAPEWFLPALLDPSRAVEGRYVNYVAVLKDGRVFTGVLTEARDNQLTLVGPTGQAQVVQRSNLDEFYSTAKSAMPDGLEKELNHQAVADVIAFLRRPAVVPAAKAGRK
jgi:putative membrane-bound dehydrogenase-like protein